MDRPLVTLWFPGKRLDSINGRNNYAELRKRHWDYQRKRSDWRTACFVALQDALGCSSRDALDFRIQQPVAHLWVRLYAGTMKPFDRTNLGSACKMAEDSLCRPRGTQKIRRADLEHPGLYEDDGPEIVRESYTAQYRMPQKEHVGVVLTVFASHGDRRKDMENLMAACDRIEDDVRDEWRRAGKLDEGLERNLLIA
jgi:hypothetical protein